MLKIFIFLIVFCLMVFAVNKIIFKDIPSQNVTDATHKAMRVKLLGIQSALDLYKLENGKYPGKINFLYDKENKYILSQQLLYDLWGRPFYYRFDENKNEYTIITFGADGKPGGTGLDEDISL
ncbi:MAG: type II secretion system protein GspG [Desulfococcaceae bacterium]